MTSWEIPEFNTGSMSVSFPLKIPDTHENAFLLVHLLKVAKAGAFTLSTMEISAIPVHIFAFPPTPTGTLWCRQWGKAVEAVQTAAAAGVPKDGPKNKNHYQLALAKAAVKLVEDIISDRPMFGEACAHALTGLVLHADRPLTIELPRWIDCAKAMVDFMVDRGMTVPGLPWAGLLRCANVTDAFKLYADNHPLPKDGDALTHLDKLVRDFGLVACMGTPAWVRAPLITAAADAGVKSKPRSRASDPVKNPYLARATAGKKRCFNCGNYGVSYLCEWGAATSETRRGTPSTSVVATLSLCLPRSAPMVALLYTKDRWLMVFLFLPPPPLVGFPPPSRTLVPSP